MYKLTAYDYKIIRTPIAKDDPCINFEWVHEQKMRLDATIVEVMALETEDPKVIEKLHTKRDEWRKQNLAYAVQIEQDGQVRRLQYMREPVDKDHPGWAYKQSKKRAWREVREFATDYPTAHFAVMGRDY